MSLPAKSESQIIRDLRNEVSILHEEILQRERIIRALDSRVNMMQLEMREMIYGKKPN